MKFVRGLASVLVLLAVILYVWSPSEEALSMAVRTTKLPAAQVDAFSMPAAPVSSALAQPVHLATAARKAAATEDIVYGSVKGLNNTKLASGSVSVVKAKRTYGGVVFASNGTFRFTLTVRAGTYSIKVRAKFGKKWYSGSKDVRFQPGREFDISAELKAEGVFTILPVGSY